MLLSNLTHPSGREYWYNEDTKETTWVKPQDVSGPSLRSTSSVVSSKGESARDNEVNEAADRLGALASCSASASPAVPRPMLRGMSDTHILRQSPAMVSQSDRADSFVRNRRFAME